MSKLTIKFSNESLPITTIMGRIDCFNKQIGDNRIDLQPSYQRGTVWSDDFKEKLIFSILFNYPIGSIIIRNLTERNNKGADNEVVDGQQRLKTIYDFVNGKFELSDELSKRIIEENKDFYNYDIENLNKKTKAVEIFYNYKKGNKVHLSYDALPSTLKIAFDSYNLAIINISHQDDTVIAEFFRFVQNQERLRAGEIINSLPNSKLEEYLDKVDSNALLEKLSWPDKRKEFDKLFYGAIGVFDEKLSMGCVDNLIVRYVTDSNGITNKALERTNRLISQLQFLVEDNSWRFTSGINKRFVKFLFMLCGYGFIDFKENCSKKIKKLYEINKKLSAFNSARAEALNEEFVGFTDEQIEKYRLIAIVSKGSQKWSLVEERMKLLAEILEDQA